MLMQSLWSLVLLFHARLALGVICRNDDPDAFCRELGGPSAYARDGQPCYDDFHDDCLCPPGYELRDEECTEDTSCDSDPETFCQEEGGPAAVPIHEGQDCYDDFEEDCRCLDGYVMEAGECVEDTSSCNNDNPDQWCRGQGGDAAYARPGESCYDSFEDDCLCQDTFIKSGGECIDDPICHKDEPDEWCQIVGGNGAYASEGKSCYDDFGSDCLCFDGYDHHGDTCTSVSWPEKQVRYVGNEGFPSSAYRLARCSGDCDSDQDCGSGLVCFQRNGNDAVPGCDGGEDEDNDYDFCVDAPTTSPTLQPTPEPTVQPSTPTPTISPTLKPTTTPSLSPTTTSPTAAPQSSPPTASPSLRAPGQGTTNHSPTRVPAPSYFHWLLPSISAPPTIQYEARYVGRFQKITGPGCSLSTPDLMAGCTSGTITLVNVSDAAINCSNPFEDGIGGSQINCTTTCLDEQCNTSFIGREFDTDFGHPKKFGEVQFQCHGNNVNAAAGWFGVIKGDWDICVPRAGEINTLFQTSQLGVWCSDLDGFSFSDALFECNWNASSIDIGGGYACTTGKACPLDKECAFGLDKVMVEGDVHKFPKTCITSSDESTIPDAPTTIAERIGNESVATIAQFHVRSGFYYNETACSATISGLEVVCVNGNISLLANRGDMECNETSLRVIECSETTATAARNAHTGVLTYQCTSNSQVPHTRVENRNSVISCDSEDDEPVSLELQLGVLCNEIYIYDDYMYECGNTSYLVSKTGNFTCGVSGVFPAGHAPIKMYPVEIETDFRWGVFGADICLDPAAAPPATVSLARRNFRSGGESSKRNENPDLLEDP